MRRRYSWDERQGDLFGAPAPKPAAAKRLAPTESEIPKEPPVQAVSLASLAQRSSRYELEDMVNEIGDEELAHLVVRGIRILKKRMARAGKGGGDRTLNARRHSPLDRALQEIASEISSFDETDGDW
jgi:hypothetical protein